MPITQNQSSHAKWKNPMCPSNAGIALKLAKLGYTWYHDVDSSSVRVCLAAGLVGYYETFEEFEQDCYRSGVLLPIDVLENATTIPKPE